MRARFAIALAIGLATLVGCDVDLERMIDQQSYRSYEPNPYLPRNTTMQAPPPGTVSRTAVIAPPEVLEGLSPAGTPVAEIPIPVTRELVLRGQNRYEIFCGPCHGRAGYANTEVAENMSLRPPPALLLPRLVEAPPGHIFRVATAGYGLMPSYDEQLSVTDRWAVVAYVQALQLSQRARLDALPAELREEARPWLK